jgi:signal transduction histidine kinase
VDAAVAACFVVAALVEAIVRHHAIPGLLAFEAGGSLGLVSLAVRRTRPLLPILVISVVGVFGTVATEVVWPDVPDDGGVWILAMLLASYSVGAHAAGRSVVVGVLAPLVVVSSADIGTRSGWERVSGMVFVTVFIGLLPTVVGRLVRVRRTRLAALREQHDRIVRAQAAQQEAAALDARLRETERLRPTLVDGLRDLAEQAAADGDPGAVEAAARALLGRTREEVVALTAPVDPSPVDDVPVADHLRVLRSTAQPWVVLAAGGVVAGLALETTRTLTLEAPGAVALPAAVAVGVPLAFAWWRPLTAAVATWCAAAAYSQLVAPLDGSLSETALAMALAFAVALLSPRRAAVVGLVVCWLGQLIGVGTTDPVGEAVMLFICWSGGVAVNEVSRLVEQARHNNELLARTEKTSAAQAVLEERLRLARDIHDAIGHSLTVVALQAGAARRLASEHPERAREVMRTVAGVAADGAASLDHDAGDTDVAALVERVRSTGLSVEADLHDLSLLDAEQGRFAYRVIREGLTNALRHAPGCRAEVVVRRDHGVARVTVTTSAPASAGTGPGTGRGLTGLREQVRAGLVTWGPRADGGFELRALLPVAHVEQVRT